MTSKTKKNSLGQERERQRGRQKHIIIIIHITAKDDVIKKIYFGTVVCSSAEK